MEITITLDRKKFFELLRSEGLFETLYQSQVNGLSFLLDGWEESSLKDLRWLAYILGTVYWETARTFQPIKERGSLKYLRSKPYWPYYGRGYVQLTWEQNYKLMASLWEKTTGEEINLVQNPDLAQEPRVARFILFEGMTKGYSEDGDFTGKSLEDYFNKDLTDWINARKIINGLDKAKDIGEIAKKFYFCLRKASGER